jgi:toxin-antitoxin system PIN domain toxin
VIIPDVNVLLYAYDEALPHHDDYAAWLTRLATGPAPFGLSELVAFGFVRIVTNPKIMAAPASSEQALAFLAELQARPNCQLVRPGPSHFTIFSDLCRSLALRGNLVSDAHHAALAIVHGGVWATSDSDFERFPELLWIHPLHQGLGRQAGPGPDFAHLAAMVHDLRGEPARYSGGSRLILQSRCRMAIRQRPRAVMRVDPGFNAEDWATVEAFARQGR